MGAIIFLFVVGWRIVRLIFFTTKLTKPLIVIKENRKGRVLTDVLIGVTSNDRGTPRN